MHHNVLAEDINDGKLEYAKVEKDSTNNCVSLSHNNIFQKAHQWASFRMKKRLGIIVPKTLFHMCKSGQFYMNSTRVSLLQSTSMNIGGVAFVDIKCMCK